MQTLSKRIFFSFLYFRCVRIEKLVKFRMGVTENWVNKVREIGSIDSITNAIMMGDSQLRVFT